jgi:hypothetical protein
MDSYNSFIDNINDNFMVPHLQIKRFEEGFYDNMQSFETQNEEFPFCWLVPLSVEHLENSVSEYNVRMYFIDILEKDDSNERDILSDQLQIARDFTNWLRQNENNGFNLLRNPSSTPVKSVLLDYTAGWYTDFSIEVDTEMSECTIPFIGTTGGTMTCPDGTVFNSGSTYSVSVPAGTTLQLPNITISNSTGGTIAILPSVVDYTIPDVSWTDSNLSGMTTPYGQPIVCGVSVIAYEYVSDFVSPYSYIGTAINGSATSALAWSITRIDMNTLVSTTPSIGIAIWDNRLSYTYI